MIILLSYISLYTVVAAIFTTIEITVGKQQPVRIRAQKNKAR
ncbi:MAG: hypothetical protein V4691_03575 [Pseudomonadota bacterium]